tara:strand:+ start:73 stop:321 length:249 start_codon:yes stop_codon:yes gene_type:complete
MTHKQKIKLARKLLTQEEIKEHTPKFTSKGWEERKEAIRIRLGGVVRVIKKPAKELTIDDLPIKENWFLRVWKRIKRWLKIK